LRNADNQFDIPKSFFNSVLDQKNFWSTKHSALAVEMLL